MKFITLAELEDIELREDVKEVEFNGISWQDGSSNWYTIYYTDGTSDYFRQYESVDVSK